MRLFRVEDCIDPTWHLYKMFGVNVRFDLPGKILSLPYTGLVREICRLLYITSSELRFIVSVTPSHGRERGSPSPPRPDTSTAAPPISYVSRPCLYGLSLSLSCYGTIL